MGAGDSSRFRDSTQESLCNHTKNVTKLPKKQWIRIGAIPLWLKVAIDLHNVYPFSQSILTAKGNEIPYMHKYLDSYALDYKLIEGGASRQESLQNAINALNADVDFVLVHDIARCLVSEALCQRILKEVGNYDCVVPYLSLCDTIAYQENDGLQYLKRDSLKIIQTPQLSRLSILKPALDKGDFTDESSAISAHGGQIGFVLGDKEAKKLTFLEDLEGMRLQSPSRKTLIGLGSDIHALDKGDGIILGGIPIPCPFKLIAHSDGDVCLHALCDAILGAIGAGDIGEWFPDNDDNYKGADSKELLQTIVSFSTEVGYAILQTDITIFAQKPKIAPYKSAIEKNIAKILGIPSFKVNLKATTTEKLGFIGREEGILAQANVVLEYFNWKRLQKGLFHENFNH